MFNLYLKKAAVIQMIETFELRKETINSLTSTRVDGEVFYPMVLTLCNLGRESVLADNLIREVILNSDPIESIHPEKHKDILSTLWVSVYYRDTRESTDSTLLPLSYSNDYFSATPKGHSLRKGPVMAAFMIHYATSAIGEVTWPYELWTMLQDIFESTRTVDVSYDLHSDDSDTFRDKFNTLMNSVEDIESGTKSGSFTVTSIESDDPLNFGLDKILVLQYDGDVEGSHKVIGGYDSELRTWFPLFTREELRDWYDKYVPSAVEPSGPKDGARTIVIEGVDQKSDSWELLPFVPGTHVKFPERFRYGTLPRDAASTVKFGDLSDSKIHGIMGTRELLFSLVTLKDSSGEVRLSIVDLRDKKELLLEHWHPKSAVYSIQVINEFFVRNPNTYFNLESGNYGRLLRDDLLSNLPTRFPVVNPSISIMTSTHHRSLSEADMLGELPAYHVTEPSPALTDFLIPEIDYSEDRTSPGNTNFFKGRVYLIDEELRFDYTNSHKYVSPSDTVKSDKVCGFNIRFAKIITTMHNDPTKPDIPVTIPVVEIEAVVMRHGSDVSGIWSKVALLVTEVEDRICSEEAFNDALLEYGPVTEFFKRLFNKSVTPTSHNFITKAYSKVRVTP